MICGLDISSTTIGWCLYQNDSSKFFKLETPQSHCFTLGHFKPDIVKDLNSKTEFFLTSLQKLLDDQVEPVTDIFVENYLLSFSGGKTTKQTIMLLAQYNALCQYIIFKHFSHINLHMIHVQTARKQVLGKIPKIKGSEFTSQKEYVGWWFDQHVKYDFPQMKRKQKDIAESKDMKDAYIIAVGGGKLKKLIT